MGLCDKFEKIPENEFVLLGTLSENIDEFVL